MVVRIRLPPAVIKTVWPPDSPSLHQTAVRAPDHFLPLIWPRCIKAPGGHQWLLGANQMLTEPFCSDGSRRQSSWPGLRRSRRLWRSWQAEAEAAIRARRYPPSWPVASMAALIKVNGLVLVELISFSPAWPGLPAAETWSMRGTPGLPHVLGLEPAAASLTSIGDQKGDILYSVLGGGGFWKQLPVVGRKAVSAPAETWNVNKSRECNEHEHKTQY